MRSLTDKEWHDILTATLNKVDSEIKITKEAEENCRGNRDLVNSMYLHLGALGAFESIIHYVADISLKKARSS